jgi:hypothetical protein
MAQAYQRSDPVPPPPHDYRAVLAARRERGQASKWAPIGTRQTTDSTAPAG